MGYTWRVSVFCCLFISFVLFGIACVLIFVFFKFAVIVLYIYLFHFLFDFVMVPFVCCFDLLVWSLWLVIGCDFCVVYYF